MKIKTQTTNLKYYIHDDIYNKILTKLVDERAYTSRELGLLFDVSSKEMDTRLEKLIEAGLVEHNDMGRHEYYKIAGVDLANEVKSLEKIHPETKDDIDKSDPHGAVKYCRTCYSHLAGKVGVMMTDNLLARDLIELQDKSFVVTDEGIEFFKKLDIDVDVLRNKRMQFAKPCLDYSERRYHLAGTLGKLLLKKMLKEGWLRLNRTSRAVSITPAGEQALADLFDLEF